MAGASIPNLVEEEDLPWANGQVAIGRHLGSFIGPLLGTQLIVLLAGDALRADRLLGAGAFVFGLNAATFLVLRMADRDDARAGSTTSDPRESEHAGIRAGFRYAMSDRVLRAILLGWSVLLLGVGLILVAELPYALRVRQGGVRVRVDLRALGRRGGARRRVRGAMAHGRPRARGRSSSPCSSAA